MRTQKTDVYLLLASALLALALPAFLWGPAFLSLEEIEIQTHDTYFVFVPWHLSLLIFVVLGFWLFLIRSIASGFRNRVAVVLLGLFLLIVGYWIFMFVSSVSAVD
jgi:hypothetical protein